MRRRRTPGRHDEAPAEEARLSTLAYGGENFFVFAVAATPSDITPLSPAEADIIAGIARGMSNSAIAEARQTSVYTVANQVATLLQKTGCRSRTELARVASGLTRKRA